MDLEVNLLTLDEDYFYCGDRRCIAKDMQYIVDYLQDNYVIPSDVVCGGINKEGRLVPNDKHNITKEGYVIIVDGQYGDVTGYYLANLIPENEQTKYPDIHCIGLKEETSGEWDFYILRYTKSGVYKVLIDDLENRVSDQWNDTDARYITPQVLAITFDLDEDSNATGSILFNVITGKTCTYSYNSALPSSHDDHYLSYWTIQMDDFGSYEEDEEEDKEVFIDLFTMEEVDEETAKGKKKK